MNKTVKIVSTLMIALMLIMVVVPSFAANPGAILGEIDNKVGNDYNTIQGYTQINKTAGRIIKIIRYIAVVIGVILIAVFGIKFMLGSAEEKAEYKKSFVPLIVGIVVVFGATYIAQVLFSLAK